MSPATATPLSSKPKELPAKYNFLAGGIAGVTEILSMYPLDMVKTRFQLQTSLATPTTHPRYTSVWDCLTQIVRKEGPLALYRGLLPPVLVESPRRAVKFAAYEHFTQVYRNLFHSEQVTRPISVISGASGGVVEGALVVSFELVKIRLQDRANVPSSPFSLSFLHGLFGLGRKVSWNNGCCQENLSKGRYYGIYQGI